jgi:hypothetical protein
MKRRAVVFVVFALGIAVVILAFTQVQLSALQEPGKLEALLATQVKRLLIYRDSRSSERASAVAPTQEAAIEEARKLDPEAAIDVERIRDTKSGHLG